MKKYLFLLLLALLCGGAPIGAQANLTVSITDVKAAGTGNLIILLFNNPESFGKKLDGAIRQVTLNDFGASAKHTFGELAPGKYAVLVFQDLNGNGTLDKNFIGFPKEPLSASNMTGMRRPSFARSAITINTASVTTELKLFNQ